MSPARHADFAAFSAAIGGGIGVCLAVALTTGNWIIGAIIGLAVCATTAGKADETIRRRKGLPPRRALIELGGKRDRPPQQ